MSEFRLNQEFSPKGDQQKAIDFLTDSIKSGQKEQVLLGVTGSGKTFTMANIIRNLNKPTLVMAHNKTLAAQLYSEFKIFFPDNAVGYFVSYYNYYQPEAYIPQTDTYIEKDSSINDAIDRMRHEATKALFERNDVIIVASVSCIYGLGSPEAYSGMLLFIEEGQDTGRDVILHKLVEMQYERNNIEFKRGNFRVKGDVLEIFPASAEKNAIRIEMFGDTVDGIFETDPLLGKVIRRLPKIAIYPKSHYVIPPERIERALENIETEMIDRVDFLRRTGKLVEAERLETRTRYDMEMISEIGHCKGVENYSRHLTGSKPGEPPPTLLDYFPREFLIIVDESHVTIPQIGGMYAGDFSRKSTLVDFGFRLPSALDNRPLKFAEFEKMTYQLLSVSATPGQYELDRAGNNMVEQVIRPTGLLDPEIEVKPAKNQVDDLIEEIRVTVGKGYRVLVTALTKKMSEDLAEYFKEIGMRVEYLHSEINALERVELIRNLRLGEFDVLVGVNLLREGLDIPEVALVAILDADKEGFLRSFRALIQTAGRTARNVDGRVIMYADHITESMRTAIDVTKRRRRIQKDYNLKNNITPTSIVKNIHPKLYEESESDYCTVELETNMVREQFRSPEDMEKRINALENEMFKEAKKLNFERAAEIRDEIESIRKSDLFLGGAG